MRDRARGGLAGPLDSLPTLARTGLARLLVDPRNGQPVAQARQFILGVV